MKEQKKMKSIKVIGLFREDTTNENVENLIKLCLQHQHYKNVLSEHRHQYKPQPQAAIHIEGKKIKHSKAMIEKAIKQLKKAPEHIFSMYHNGRLL